MVFCQIFIPTIFWNTKINKGGSAPLQKPMGVRAHADCLKTLFNNG